MGYPAATKEGLEPEGEWWPRLNRQEQYEEALRAAHQRALDTTEALQGVLKDRVGEPEVDHKLAPKPATKATVEVILEAEVGVAVGLTARVIPRMALRVDSHSLLMDLHLGEG